jgi:hypothetical protein
MSGWLNLTQLGPAPNQKHQALLGAPKIVHCEDQHLMSTYTLFLAVVGPILCEPDKTANGGPRRYKCHDKQIAGMEPGHFMWKEAKG